MGSFIAAAYGGKVEDALDEIYLSGWKTFQGVRDCVAALRDIPADRGDLHNIFAPDEPPGNRLSGGATPDECFNGGIRAKILYGQRRYLKQRRG